MLCRIQQANSVLSIKHGLDSYSIHQDLGLSQEEQCFGLSEGRVRLLMSGSSKSGEGTKQQGWRGHLLDICGPLINQGTRRLHALLRTIRADGNNVETLFSSSLELSSTGHFLPDEEQCLGAQRCSRRNQEVLPTLMYQHAGAVCHSAPRRLGSLTSRGRKLWGAWTGFGQHCRQQCLPRPAAPPLSENLHTEGSPVVPSTTLTSIQPECHLHQAGKAGCLCMPDTHTSEQPLGDLPTQLSLALSLLYSSLF